MTRTATGALGIAGCEDREQALALLATVAKDELAP
jgi:hypothetical protein